MTPDTPETSTPPASTSSGDLLDQPYAVTDDQIARFAEDGFIRLTKVFNAVTLDTYASTITQLTFARNPNKDVDLNQLDTYGQAFIQVTNLWLRSSFPSGRSPP